MSPEELARLREEFAKRFARRGAAADAIDDPELETTSPRDDIRELVRTEVDARIRELLGESRRVPIGLLSQRSGISSDALRMRARRLGIKTVRDGRIVTIALSDVDRLLRNATPDS